MSLLFPRRYMHYNLTSGLLTFSQFEEHFRYRTMNLTAMIQPETSVKSKARLITIKEPDVKPKKANSEARKQQNRIASRNYRTFARKTR